MPCSSPPQWPARIVRRGRGYACLQDAHRLEHRERAGAVVGRARRAVPAVEVRRQQHVLVRQLGPLELGDDVEHRHFGRRRLRLGGEANARALVVRRQAMQQPVVLAREVDASARARAFAPKILFTPQPPDHVSVPTPMTPAESRRIVHDAVDAPAAACSPARASGGASAPSRCASTRCCVDLRDRRRPRVALELLRRATHDLRRRHEHELAAHGARATASRRRSRRARG